MKEEKISVRISARSKMRVSEIADKMKVSSSLVIRALIERSLDDIEDEETTEQLFNQPGGV